MGWLIGLALPAGGTALVCLSFVVARRQLHSDVRAIAAVLGLIAASFGGIVATYQGCAKSDLAAGVTVNSIRALELGMSPAEVEGVLGPPLDAQGNYSRGVTGASWFVTLRLSFGTEGLGTVTATRYESWLGDHYVIYLKGPSYPDGWEHSAFRTSFP
jgi:hypothetical protein